MTSPKSSAYRNIAQLSADAAAGLHFSHAYGLKVWLKSATALQDRARELEEEGNFEQAFVLNARAATLIIEKIPSHPEAPKYLTAEHISNLKAHGQVCLRDLARLRTKLVELDHIRSSAPTSTSSPTTRVKHLSADRQPSFSPPPSAHGHRLLHSSSGNRQRASSGASSSEEHERKYRHLDVAYRGMGLGGDMGREESISTSQAPISRASSPPPTNTIIAYPSVPQPSASAGLQAYNQSYSTAPVPTEQTHQTSRNRLPPPVVPRRPVFPAMRPEDRSAGAGYYAGSESSSSRHTPPPHLPPTSSAQQLRRDTIPASDNNRSQSTALSGSLRRLRLPTSTLSTFLQLAHTNTSRGIETCALLLGTIELRFGAVQELVVQMLLIPKQRGTGDTCVMEEEEGVVGVQLERGLTALGWIHTHPTQTCFMSSMDLHTHAAYQQTLPEAIAIVCAPRSNPSYGIFRLTEPGGLETILQCRNARSFHEHADVRGGIYTDADHGHVKLRDGPLEVIDLRRRG